MTRPAQGRRVPAVIVERGGTLAPWPETDPGRRRVFPREIDGVALDG